MGEQQSEFESKFQLEPAGDDLMVRVDRLERLLKPLLSPGNRYSGWKSVDIEVDQALNQFRSAATIQMYDDYDVMNNSWSE